MLAAALVAACTTIGTPNPELLAQMAARGEFGTAQQLRVCALLDEGVDEAMARGLVEEAWNRSEAAPLGLEVVLASLRPWKSEGSDTETIFRHVRKMPIPPECDRVFAFVAPSEDSALDAAGAVTLAHGFAVITPSMTRRHFMTPAEVVRHEFYHLVGCGHAQTMDECYRRIARAKGERRRPTDFFPVFQYVLDEDIERNCGANRLFDERAEVNRTTRLWLAEGERIASGRAPRGGPQCARE